MQMYNASSFYSNFFFLHDTYTSQLKEFKKERNILNKKEKYIKFSLKLRIFYSNIVKKWIVI